MNTFGFMNKWGGSLSRVFLFGGIILVVYATIYMTIDNGNVLILHNDKAQEISVKNYYYFMSCLVKSFDITFLAGYTKHITTYDNMLKQLIILSNMLVGLFWYVVMIPTLINKISITRL